MQTTDPPMGLPDGQAPRRTTSQISEPPQAAPLVKPVFAVGELVQVEIGGAYVFSEPKPITQVTEDGGSFWYLFEGSDSGVPEGQLRRVDTHERGPCPSETSEPSQAPVLSAPPKRGRRPAASDRPVSRVPNNYLGKLLDQGKPSAAAIKLLAIKYAQGGPGFVVSERLAATHGMGWREYRSGLKLLKTAGIIGRWQDGRRSFPKERLVTAASRNYTPIEAALLALPAKVVAFILAANLSPKPALPAKLCERLGISSDATIRKTTEAAIASGAVAVWRPRKGPHLVGRPGTVFDVMQSGHPVKNGATKNGATLSSRETPSESERDSRTPSKSHSLMGGAAGLLKGEPAEDLKSELVEELRAADHAGALHACLLSRKGVEGYQALVLQYGVAARSVVLARLFAFAIDGATPGQIWTWNYFRDAIADEFKHTRMNETGVRPGDVVSLQRELELRPEAKNGRHG